MISIRTATEDDAEELLAIYAPYVKQTTITFEYDVPSKKDFKSRISHTLEKYPYLVAAMPMSVHLRREQHMTGLLRHQYM